MRFICATILHLSLLDETFTALLLMKFGANHSYLFSNVNLAFICSCFQFIMTLSVEIVNIALICTGVDAINIVLNFIALAIIAEFDNFIFNSLRSEFIKKFTDSEVSKKILRIRHTTSTSCGVEELTDIKDENNNFRPLRIQFSSRTCLNKFLYVYYKMLRCLYVSLYFYFMPFLVIFASIIIPLVYRFEVLDPDSQIS